jgi:mannose-6-phosphate isomerase-like protein (cupin superfamily)
MNRFLLVLFTAVTCASVSAQAIAKRIVRNDPSKYRSLAAVHAGAGKMGFTQLIGSQALSTNFLYLHAGAIEAKSGIGHHFHHSIEEMYVLLDGEAEFTINGHTSKLKAPAVVPCKLGDAHAIYNATAQPVKWLNFAVSLVKGRGENFDLGDTRVGAALDPIPVFVSSQLKKDNLRSNNTVYPGSGALYRRALGPGIFGSSWNHVDHVVIPAGGSGGPRQLEGIEEVYYVMKGTGTLTVNGDSTPIKGDDAFPVLLGETMKLANTGNTDLELLVVGVSSTKMKGVDPTKRLAAPKGIALQMDFIVAKENSEAFEKMYQSIYVPAMTVQQGYLWSKLLRLFPTDASKAIEAEPTEYNYQVQIAFDTEENRRRWVASDQHKIAWPAASKLAKAYKWRGYDVMGEDEKR